MATPELELRYALLEGNVARARAALDAGADANGEANTIVTSTTQTPHRWPLLVAAAIDGRVGIVELLLDRGARIEAQAVYDWPVHTSSDYYYEAPAGTALFYAAAHGRLAVVELLLARGAKADVLGGFNCDEKAIDVAAKRGHTGVVERLRAALPTE